MSSLADLLWAIVRWAVPCTVAGVIALVAVGMRQVDDRIRSHVEQRLATIFPSLHVEVAAARLVEGQGILVQGVALTAVSLPHEAARLIEIDELMLACSTDLAELVSGGVRLSGIHLRRPTVHAVALERGQWNLGQLRPQGSGGSLVPVTVEDAAITIDRDGQRTTLRDLECRIGTASDSPHMAMDGWVDVQIATVGDALGRLQLAGRIRPADLAFQLQGSAASIDLSERLWSLLPAGWRSGIVPGGEAAADMPRSLRGRFTLDFTASGSLDDPSSIEAVADGFLESGRLDHPAIPFPLTDINARLRVDRSGAECSSFSARSGASVIRGHGRLGGWNPAADFELLVEAERLHVGRHWEPHLPEAVGSHFRKLLPAGEVDLRAHLVRTGAVIRPNVSLRCRNVSLTHYRFPYRLDRVVGTVVLDGDELTLHLIGQAGTHAVHVDGRFTSPGPQARGFIEVRGEGMRMDDALIEAMPRRSAEIVRSLRAAGTFDFAFRHQRSPELPTGHSNQLGIRLTDCRLTYALFPYPLSNVTGQVHMRDDHWSIRDCTGRNDTGVVRCSGELLPLADGDGQLTLDFTGTSVVLENELRDALPAGMRRIWDDVSPRGAIDLSARVMHRVRNRVTTVEVQADPHEETVSVEPSWFPYRIEKLDGRLRWKDGMLTFENVRGVHARTSVAAAGICRFTPDGGWHVSFERLSADRFRVDHDLLQALPTGLHDAVAAVRPQGLLSLDGSLDVYSTRGNGQAGHGPAAAAWDMRLDVEQGSLAAGFEITSMHGGMRLVGSSDGTAWQARGDVLVDSAIWRGMQLRQVQGPLVMDSRGVRFGGFAVDAAGGQARRMTARLAEGALAMDGGVASDGSFRIVAALQDASLERLAADLSGASTAYRGTLDGNIELTGVRAARHSLSGRGQLRLQNADLYELPLIVALLKVLRVKAPDRNAFKSSLVDFRIEGPHAYLDTVELAGDAVSLVGNGEIDFDSNVHLTFRSIMGDSEAHLPVMKRMLGGASGQFMLIHVDGTLAAPEMTSEAFPSLNALVQRFQSQGIMGPEGRQRSLARVDDGRREQR